ncbi:hypothetical protein ACU4GH_15200 [Bradyrhizobium betae]
MNGPQRPGESLFATGHVGFDYAARFESDPVIFTVLREPMARCLSAYHFFQSHSEAYLRSLATELSAEEYQGRLRFQERARELGPARFLPRRRSWRVIGSPMCKRDNWPALILPNAAMTIRACWMQPCDISRGSISPASSNAGKTPCVCSDG